jgi:hypothetical protein
MRIDDRKVLEMLGRAAKDTSIAPAVQEFDGCHPDAILYAAKKAVPKVPFVVAQIGTNRKSMQAWARLARGAALLFVILALRAEEMAGKGGA